MNWFVGYLVSVVISLSKFSFQPENSEGRYAYLSFLGRLQEVIDSLGREKHRSIIRLWSSETSFEDLETSKEYYLILESMEDICFLGRFSCFLGDDTGHFYIPREVPASTAVGGF